MNQKISNDPFSMQLQYRFCGRGSYYTVPDSIAMVVCADFVRSYLDRCVNQLPWDRLRLLAIEDLRNLKKGKTKNRSRAFRRASAPWTYRQVIEAVTQKAQEHGVHLVSVPPDYTSRTCPMCGRESKSSRKGELFACVFCAYTADADTVGAVNILNKALALDGSVESPLPSS